MGLIESSSKSHTLIGHDFLLVIHSIFVDKPFKEELRVPYSQNVLAESDGAFFVFSPALWQKERHFRGVEVSQVVEKAATVTSPARWFVTSVPT
jgi:hypothetical protein